MTTDLRIRAGSLRDAPLLLALKRRSSLANPEDRAVLLAHPDAIRMPEEHLQPGRCAVAELQAEVAGFAVVMPRADDAAQLEALFVEPGLWRRGIGRALAEACTGLARQQQARTLWVVAGRSAEPFYARLGFMPVRVVQTRFAAATEMRLPLQA